VSLDLVMGLGLEISEEMFSFTLELIYLRIYGSWLGYDYRHRFSGHGFVFINYRTRLQYMTLYYAALIAHGRR
jgi:hypothetical protein